MAPEPSVVASTYARQRGVALLTVLFMLVLLTTLITYMIEDEQMAIQRVSNQRDVEQSYQLVMGAEQWLAKLLERDMLNTENDHLEEDWNKAQFSTGVDEGKLAFTVSDLQGRFNINNLKAGKDEVWYPAFQRLLRVLELEESLADAVLDWIDENQDVTGGRGAEDGEYLSAETPYRSANQTLTGVGELIWIKGFDEKVVETLAPHVCVLPTDKAKINVNTASATVLRILAPDLLSAAAAESLIEGRGETGYEKVTDFLQAGELAGEAQQKAQPLVDVSSNFFEIESRAEYGRFRTMLYSVIERRPNSQKIVLTQRRRGII